MCLTNIAMPHFVDCLGSSMDSDISLYSCGWNNTERRSGGGLPLSNISSSINTTMLEFIKNIHVPSFLGDDETQTTTAGEAENIRILWIYICRPDSIQSSGDSRLTCIITFDNEHLLLSPPALVHPLTQRYALTPN